MESGVISPFNPDLINGASIDITLGADVYAEALPLQYEQNVDLSHKEQPLLRKHTITGYDRQ